MESRRILRYPEARRSWVGPTPRTSTTRGGRFCRWLCSGWARTWRGPRWGYPLKLQREIDTCNDHHHFFKSESMWMGPFGIWRFPLWHTCALLRYFDFCSASKDSKAFNFLVPLHSSQVCVQKPHPRYGWCLHIKYGTFILCLKFKIVTYCTLI